MVKSVWRDLTKKKISTAKLDQTGSGTGGLGVDNVKDFKGFISKELETPKNHSRFFLG